MKNYKALLFLMIPIIGATLFFTARITTQLSHYEAKKLEKAELLDAEARLGNAWEWLPSWLSGADETMEKSWELDRQANRYYSSAIKDSLIFLALVVAFLVAINLIYKNPEVRQQAIGLSLIIASACFLYLGLNEPFIP